MSIGDCLVGGEHACFVAAEIGINHDGDLEMAKPFRSPVAAEFRAVKFPRRTVDAVSSREELARSRESPLGETNDHLQQGLDPSENPSAEERVASEGRDSVSRGKRAGKA